MVAWRCITRDSNSCLPKPDGGGCCAFSLMCSTVTAPEKPAFCISSVHQNCSFWQSSAGFPRGKPCLFMNVSFLLGLRNAPLLRPRFWLEQCGSRHPLTRSPRAPQLPFISLLLFFFV